MFCVYWIRLKEHTNILTEGYVGISLNLPQRLKAHKKCRRKTHFVSAIKHYGWSSLIVEVLHDGISLQEALLTEFSLRPTQNIGWNCQRGGELGVESSWYNIDSNRQKHKEATAEATKKGISLKDTPEARAERARQSWANNREKYSNVSVGSNNPKAILTEEQVREIKEKLSYSSTRELANLYSVRIHVIQQIKSGKNWSHI